MKSVFRELEPDFKPAAPTADIRLRMHVDESGHHLNTLTAIPEKAPNGTLVVALPWGEHGSRPDATLRYAKFSEALGVTLAAVDTPGMGDRPSRLDRDALAAVNRGDFDEIATRQWEALAATGLEFGRISLLGYSLGASLATSLAKTAPEGTRIDRAIFWEPAGVVEQPFMQLARDFAWESGAQKRYAAENPDWMPRPSLVRLPLQIAAHPFAYGAYPRGLARGTMIDDLRVAREREALTTETDFVVISGDKSRVAPPVIHQILGELATELSLNSFLDLSKNESHAIIDSVPRSLSTLETYR